MKKPLIALSFAVASALALADSEQHNPDWFSGIGSDATLSDMKATNGSWTFPTTEDCAKVENNALVLDLDGAEEATFKITDSSEAGATQTLTVTGVFAPIAKDDLLSGAVMTEKGAQVGFAVVTEDSGNSFYAWVGATGGDDASANWQKLFSAEAAAATLAADADGEKTLAITLSYNPSKITAKFSVSGLVTTTAEGETGSTPTDVTVTSEALELTGGAETVAKEKKAIASVSCTGSGSLTAMNGTCNYAVAEGVKADGTVADGWKFDTAVDAIAAAQSTGGSGTIKLLQAVSDQVEVSGGLRVWWNNDEALKASVNSSFTHKKENSYPSLATVNEKEGYHEWQVNNDVLESVAINDKKIGMGSDSSALQDAFRTFLEKNCGDAYRSSTVTAGTLAEALNGTGTNGYPLWQSFVMGVDADETVKLAPATTDTEEDGISLTLANTIPASPYDSAIKYTVTKNGGTAGTETAITRTSPVVKIPLETGHYSVKFTIGE